MRVGSLLIDYLGSLLQVVYRSFIDMLAFTYSIVAEPVLNGQVPFHLSYLVNFSAILIIFACLTFDPPFNRIVKQIQLILCLWLVVLFCNSEQRRSIDCLVFVVDHYDLIVVLHCVSFVAFEGRLLHFQGRFAARL